MSHIPRVDSPDQTGLTRLTRQTSFIIYDFTTERKFADLCKFSPQTLKLLNRRQKTQLAVFALGLFYQGTVAQTLTVC